MKTLFQNNIFLREPFFRNKGTLFAKQTVLDILLPKNSNVGKDLTVPKRIRHHRIKSFTQFFSKKLCGSRGAEPLESDDADMLHT